MAVAAPPIAKHAAGADTRAGSGPRSLSRVLALRLAELPGFAALLGLLGLFALTVRERIGFPYDLEWMEGGMLVHVLRLREGLPVYAAPSLDFVPYIYPPAYPWLLSWLGEPSYALGRGVSLVATLVAAAAAAWLVRREGAGAGFSAAAAALFLSCYEDSGSFYDLVRGDALATALLALACGCARGGRRLEVSAAGLLLAGAFAAKHNFALFGLPLLLWLWRFRGPRAAALFAAASAGPALLFVGGMQLATDGAFLVYLLGVPASHPLRFERAWQGGIEQGWIFAPAAGVALVVALFALRDRVRRSAPGGAAPERALSEGAWFHLGLLVTAFPLAVLMRAHTGGFVNVLMPSHWVMATALAALLGSVARERVVASALLASVLALQAWSGRWEPERLVPGAHDRAGGDALIEALRGIEGEVFVPHGPWYPYLAGKSPGLALIALWDVDHRGGPYAGLAGRQLRESFAARRWAAVVTPLGQDLKYDLAKHYQRVGVLPGSLATVAGWRVRFGEVWRPQPYRAGALRRH